jgi:hypothetical protein
MSLPSLVHPGGAFGPLYGKGWDLCRLGRIALPGKWKVVVGGIALKVDHHRKGGVHGANPVLHGIDPKEFQILGEQWTDEQRDKLVEVCAKLLPSRGALTLPPATTVSGISVATTGPPEKQYPMPLDHPSVAHIPFPINVIVLGCGILEYVGPCTTHLRIDLLHWLPARPSDPSAVIQPTRAIRDKVTEDTARINPPNPLPTTVPGIAGPPIGFQPGQGQ